LATGETKKRWEGENVVRVNLNLNKNYDADILDALARAKEETGEASGAAMKRWARAGIELDKGTKK
jgi:hypothetical protein